MPLYGPWIDSPDARVDPTGAYAPVLVSTAEPPSNNALDAAHGSTPLDTATGPFFQLLNQAGPTTEVQQGTMALTVTDPDLNPPNIDPATWPPGAIDYEYESRYGTIASVWFQATLVIGVVHDTVGSTGLLLAPSGPGWVTPAMAGALPVLAETAMCAPGDSQLLTLDDGSGNGIDVTAHLVDRTVYLLTYPRRAIDSPSGYVDYGPSYDETRVNAYVGAAWHLIMHVPRHRFIYDTTPPLRQRQRASGLAGTGGPPLRQIGGWHAAGDQPPLRQRQNP